MELPISLFSMWNKVSITVCQGINYCKFTIWAHVKFCILSEFLRFWQKGSPSLENACYGPDVHSGYNYVPYTHSDMDDSE